MADSISGEGVCRTAPTTPGLLNFFVVVVYNNSITQLASWWRKGQLIEKFLFKLLVLKLMVIQPKVLTGHSDIRILKPAMSESRTTPVMLL